MRANSFSSAMRTALAFVPWLMEASFAAPLPGCFTPYTLRL
jgi:hypothetical protein